MNTNKNRSPSRHIQLIKVIAINRPTKEEAKQKIKDLSKEISNTFSNVKEENL